MRRGLALLALVAVSCGDAAQIPEVDARLAVRSDAAETDVGRGVRVTVERVWRRDLRPAPWDHEALAPLAARLVTAVRRETRTHAQVIETWECYSFVPGDVVVRPASFEVADGDGGVVRAATAEPLRLRVRPTLDPANPGTPELPGGLIPVPVRWGRWLAAGAAACVVAALVVSRRRRRAPAPVVPVPPVETAAVRSPEDVALERLAEVRTRDSATARALESDCGAVALVLREYVAARFGVTTAEKTTPEILASLAEAAPEEQRSALWQFLSTCDLVKFARRAVTREDRDRLLGEAEAIVLAARRPSS